MTTRLAALVLGLGVAIPLLGSDHPQTNAPKQPFEVTKQVREPVGPGSIVRVEHSYGYLTVEGWDEPEVEVTVTKSSDSFYPPQEKERVERGFDDVHIVTGRPSASEFTITTTLPVRNSLFTSVLPNGHIIVTPPLLPKNKRGITAEYTIHVPRDSHVIIHHDNGYVWVSDITGDIEVHSHTGDMIVMLPGPGTYSIDARARLGGVTSDFGSSSRRFLLGSHFAGRNDAPSRKIDLRMGRGSITIKKSPASGPYWRK
jgi:hypothetical protein